ncbi:MAG TPA: hypothetical protein VH110_03710 [Candidatus Acidoferrum sp.]|jgi:hypothetical protein|nr:hypothetical protein [Candidatus Acidoferrum sp.]
MFLALFAVSFALALALSFTVAWVSKDAIETVLRRFVLDPVVRAAFSKYLRFAMVVVGISMGTRVSPLEEYMAASYSGKVSMLAAVNQEYWVMEIYHTLLGTLEGLVWLLLSALILALMAPAILRWAKLEPAKPAEEQQKSGEPERRVTGYR